MAEARKLAGRVSAESEVTPRRSFSLNIFLQEGERVNVLVPSCRKKTWLLRQSVTQSNLYGLFLQAHQHADLIGSSLGSHGDEGVVLLLQELSGLQERSDADDTCSGRVCCVCAFISLNIMAASKCSRVTKGLDDFYF